MAAPASSQRIQPTGGSVSSAPSTPRWGRTGEPGSAFSGLGRGGTGGRGRGNGRGRGGRGGRATAAPRTTGEPGIAVVDPRSGPSSAPKLVTPAPAPPAPIPEKITIPPSSTSSRQKPPSRRGSRTVPPVVISSSPSTEVPSSPQSSTRPANRRRRSQTSKVAPAVIPKINAPPADDSRTQRTRNGFASHIAPIKDTPPHLSTSPNSFDMRTNIDALVERVRAVAMAENRPATPGSHIDWAGDDDDSLPDLDDWGITPGSISSAKDQLMSPIIVDGLRTLPELVAKPTNTRLEKNAPLVAVDDAIGHPGGWVSTFPEGHNGSDTAEYNHLADIAALPTVIEAPASHDITPPASVKIPLNSSLSSKPIITPEMLASLAKTVSATPIRHPTPPTLSGMTIKSPLKQEIQESQDKIENEQEITGSIHAPSDVQEEDASTDDKPREGLAASIHAPQGLSDSLSAPSNLASFSSTESRHAKLTHTRAHTVGRPPSFPRNTPSEFARPSRSGYSSPRGGLSQGGHHTRTHSTPPAGASPNNQRSLHARPVITTDAMSRLARAMGSSSPPKAAATVTATNE